MTAKPEENSTSAVEEAEAIVEKAAEEKTSKAGALVARVKGSVTKKHVAIASAATLGTVVLGVLAKTVFALKENEDEMLVVEQDNEDN